MSSIYIIGASGTGKTTLAKALSEKLGFPQFDSDDYYHYPTDPPFQKQRSSEERASLLTNDLSKHPSWILSGGAGVWEPRPQIEYSLVVFLYLPPEIRLERLQVREAKLYGARILSGGDMESTNREFMAWTSGYDDGTCGGTCTLPRHLSFLDSLKCRVLRLGRAMATREQVEKVIEMLHG